MIDKYTLYAFLFLITMVVLCVYLLLTFKKNQKKTMREKEESNNPDLRPVCILNDVAATFGFIGKSVKETGIEEKYIQLENGMLKVTFDGRLFGEAAHGTIYFESEGTDDIVKYANAVYIYSSEYSYEEYKKRLAALFGEPESESEEPYAEVNGGAVTRCKFNIEGAYIELSKASEREESNITVKKAR